MGISSYICVKCLIVTSMTICVQNTQNYPFPSNLTRIIWNSISRHLVIIKSPSCLHNHPNNSESIKNETRVDIWHCIFPSWRHIQTIRCSDDMVAMMVMFCYGQLEIWLLVLHNYKINTLTITFGRIRGSNERFNYDYVKAGAGQEWWWFLLSSASVMASVEVLDSEPV